MVINVTVQYNGGLLPDIILLSLCDYFGEPFKYNEELLSLQPMFPPKPFDMLRRFRCVQIIIIVITIKHKIIKTSATTTNTIQ